MPRLFVFLAATLACALLACALAATAHGQNPHIVAQASSIPWLTSSGTILALAGVAASWGRARQVDTDHDRRIVAVEGCAARNPGRLDVVIAAQAARTQVDDNRHDEVMAELRYIRKVVDEHTH